MAETTYNFEVQDFHTYYVGAGVGTVGGMLYDATNGNDFGTSIRTWTKARFGIGAISGAVIGGDVGGTAAYSVTGLANASFWTGLGPQVKLLRDKLLIAKD